MKLLASVWQQVKHFVAQDLVAVYFYPIVVTGAILLFTYITGW